MKIKGKQLEDTLRSADNPFTEVHATQFVGGMDGAIRFKCKNAEVSAMSKGQAVYISGVSGEVPEVKLADADGSGTVPAVGLTETAANASAEVYIISFGNLTGLDTSSLNTTSPYASIVGKSVYVGTTPGSLTIDPPATSSAKLQNIGQIIKEHASSGIIKVGGAGRTAATPNLDEGKFFIGDSNDQSSISAYRLPTADGSAGQVLTTDGSGLISFADLAGGNSLTTLDANVSATDLVSESHYVLPYNASADVSIELPNQNTTGAAEFYLKTFKVENRSDTYNVTITSVGNLSNSYRYYKVDGTLVSGGALSDIVSPKTTRLFYVSTYSASTYIYWRTYNDILAYPLEHLGNLSATSLSDRHIIEYDLATNSWVTRKNTGGLIAETKTADFTIEDGYVYLCSTTSGNTIIATFQSSSNYSIGDRVNIFNIGDGIVRLYENAPATNFDPYEGGSGTHGSYRDLNSKGLIQAIKTSNYTWTYVITPQLEFDQISQNGEVLYYNSTEKAMKPLPYTFPASDGSNTQILSTNGSGGLSFIDQPSSVPSLSYTALTGTVAAADFGGTNYRRAFWRINLGDVTINLPVYTDSNASSLNGQVIEIINESPNTDIFLKIPTRNHGTSRYTRLYDSTGALNSTDNYTYTIPPSSSLRLSIYYGPLGSADYLTYTILS